MGRKGVSKRKPSQTKSKQLPGMDPGGKALTVAQALENQPARPFDNGKTAPLTRGGEKPAADSKKIHKKG